MRAYERECEDARARVSVRTRARVYSVRRGIKKTRDRGAASSKRRATPSHGGRVSPCIFT